MLSLCTFVIGSSYCYANCEASLKQPSKREISSREVKKPAKQKVVSRVPSKATVVKHKGATLHISNGKYYKSVGGKYQLVAAPFGLRVSVVPPKHSIFKFRDLAYLYAAGVIYRQISSNEYEVVEPQLGMMVPELPDYNVSEVVIDGVIYFEFDDVLYMQVPTTSGLQYEVVGGLNM